MVKWRVHLAQLFALNELKPINTTAPSAATTAMDTNRNNKTLLTLFAKEFCFFMTGKKWDIPNISNFPMCSTPPIGRAMALTTTTRHAWMGDSGSSCHFTKDDTGIFQWKHIKDLIQVAGGSMIYSTKLGNINLEVQQRNGSKCRVTLENCKYIPNLATSFSR
jgi:hypothetical protein